MEGLLFGATETYLSTDGYHPLSTSIPKMALHKPIGGAGHDNSTHYAFWSESLPRIKDCLFGASLKDKKEKLVWLSKNYFTSFPPMFIQKRFIQFASICCFLTVITTLGIHLYFPDPPSGFEERLLLFRDKMYLLNRWWVIAHCLLVIVSMWGFAILQMKKAPGFTGLGFLFFVVFAIMEITRQMFVLFYMNELRQQYLLATDPAIKEGIKVTLSSAGQLSAPLFGVFIFTFGFGNLCYGLSLSRERGFSKILSALLIIWAIATFIGFGNNFWKIPAIDQFIEKYSFTFQPFMRAMLGLWLWKKSNTL